MTSNSEDTLYNRGCRIHKNQKANFGPKLEAVITKFQKMLYDFSILMHLKTILCQCIFFKIAFYYFFDILISKAGDLNLFFAPWTPKSQKKISTDPKTANRH